MEEFIKLKEHSSDLNQITIIPRNQIPAIHSIEEQGQIHNLGELRDFQWHPLLQQFMPPSSEFSISWVSLDKNQQLSTHMHPTQSMIFFYKGSGEMLGQNPQKIDAGDLIIIPPGCKHGFIGGPEGLSALSIQFGAGLYTNIEQPRVKFNQDVEILQQLENDNDACLEKFTHNPIFKLFTQGQLQNRNQLEGFLNAMNIWGKNNQYFLTQHELNAHFQKTFFDPILEGLVDWFIFQFKVLDYAEKIILIKVIEKAANYYHHIAKTHLSEKTYFLYFPSHLKINTQIINIKSDLNNLSWNYYTRLNNLLIQAWNSLEAFMKRVSTVFVEGITEL